MFGLPWYVFPLGALALVLNWGVWVWMPLSARRGERKAAAWKEAHPSYRERLERGDPLKERPTRRELWEEHRYMTDNGLLEPGESTRWADLRFREARRSPFTPSEREQIRACAGIEEPALTWRQLARYE